MGQISHSIILYSAAATLGLTTAATISRCAGPLDSNRHGAWDTPSTVPRVSAPSRPERPEKLSKPEGPLSLSACIDLALTHNPGLAADSAEAGRAAAEADLARSQRWPDVDLVPGYTHSFNAQRLVPARANGELGAFTRDVVSTDLVLSVPLFTGGQLTHRIQASEQLQKAAEHRWARSRGELTFNVNSLYYDILVQRRVIESIKISQKAIRQQRTRTKQLLEAKQVAEVDLMRVKVRLADIQQRLIKERNRLAIQKRTLGTLLGIEEQSVQVAGQLEEQASVPATQPMTDKAIVRRADYRASVAAVEAGRHRIDAAEGARWPQTYAQGAYGGRYGIDADRPRGANDLEDVGSVGIVGTIPLFDGGEIDADVLRQRFALAGQRQQLRQQKLQIGLEIETAWRNIQSAVERIEATSAAVQQAKESLRIERQKYEQGEGTIVDVLDAQAALLEAQTNYYRALGDRDTARTQLQLATGELP